MCELVSVIAETRPVLSLEYAKALTPHLMAYAQAAITSIDRQYPPFGVTDSFVPRAEDSAFYVQEGKRTVSILVWRIYEGNAWIGIGWTEPDYRKRGFYSMLYDRLKIFCLDHKIREISCGTAGNNTTSMKVHQALGMEPNMVSFCHRLS